jgi:outer membrane lipoprotein-sorting protein
MRGTPFVAMLVGTLFSLAASAVAESESAASPEGGMEEVRACMAANEPATTSIQTIELTSVDASGTETSSEGRVYWKKNELGKSNVMLRFFDPPDMRSSGLLILEEEDRTDMWMYLPEIGKIRRVNKHMAKGSLFGTDFTYEEFERLYGMVEDQNATRLEDQTLEGRAVYVVDEAHDETSSYDKTTMFIDKETCVPLKSEFFDAGDRLRKVITAKPEHLRKAGNMNYAEQLHARDLRDETESRLEVKRIEVGKSIPKRTFGLRYLETSRN